MNRRIRLSLLLLFTLFFSYSITGTVHAQSCVSEEEEVPWPVPPALAGQDGDVTQAGPATFFIGERNTGNIQVWEMTFGETSLVKTLTPGNQLPADVTGIWSLAVPAHNRVVALATYEADGTEWYGVLTSDDLGETWSFDKPTAFRDPAFECLDGQSFQVQFRNIDFTGNYWRAALLEMTWYDDNTGWIWGRKGILGTTDGGETWSVLYKTENSNTSRYTVYEGVWGLAFQSPTTGVAVLGPSTDASYYKTEDGGKTWTKGFGLQGYRPAGLLYRGGKYRSLTFRRSQTEQNAFVQGSDDGRFWAGLAASPPAIATSETVFMTEMLWPNPEEGFLVYRRGEIRATSNTGKTWSELQGEDAQYPQVIYGSGRDQPLAGYGQSSVILRDGFEDPYLVQTITMNCIGEVNSYVPAYELGQFTSVPVEARMLENFSVFPNPTSDRCEVRFSLDQPESGKIVVVDSRGDVVRNIDLGLLEAGDQTRSIDLSNLSAGSYRLMVRAGDHKGVESVVIGK